MTNDSYYKPSIGQTFVASIQKPFLKVNQLNDYIFPNLSTDQTRYETAKQLSVINEMLSNPYQNFGQKSLNTVGEIVGSIIPVLPIVLLLSVIFSVLFSNLLKKIKSLVKLKTNKDTYVTTQKNTHGIYNQEKELKMNTFNKIPWCLICGTLIVISSAFSESYNRGEWCLTIGCLVMLAELIVLFKNKHN